MSYRKVTRKVTRRPRTTFAKKVKAVISKQAEHKFVSFDSGLIPFNSGINAQNDVVQIIPASTQGIDAGSRIGNEITLKKFNIKGHYLLSTANNAVSSSCRIGVRMMVLQAKRYNSFYDANISYGNHLPDMIRTGDAVRGFTGLISDLYLPLNREVYTVLYDKVQYVTMEVILSSTGATSTRDTVRLFNINLKVLNKKLRYEDSLSNYPQNWGPFMCIGYAKMDGTAPDVAVNGISLQNISTMEFIDL